LNRIVDHLAALSIGSSGRECGGFKSQFPFACQKPEFVISAFWFGLEHIGSRAIGQQQPQRLPV
jgi:hypothetical protein